MMVSRFSWGRRAVNPFWITSFGRVSGEAKLNEAKMTYGDFQRERWRASTCDFGDAEAVSHEIDGGLAKGGEARSGGVEKIRFLW